MKRINIDEILLQIIFFAAGIYILIRIFIPMINPASMATNSDYNGHSFYEQLLNKGNSTIDIASNQDNEGSENLLSVLFTYLTGIDLSNPKTYIASELPMLQFIDIASMDTTDQPVVVVPRETEVPSTITSPSGVALTHTPPIKKPIGNSGVISTVTPVKASISRIKLVKAKPMVLIFHSHTTEAYNPDKIKEKNYSPDNLNLTINKVGEALEYELESKYGISTIHDSKIHDLPTRGGAYKRARPTVQSYLKKYPNLKLIIDLHRDGDVKRNIETAIIKNEKFARVEFVVGTKFKNHEKNNKVTLGLNSEFNYLYPGFARNIVYKTSTSTYNQDLSPRMVLLEVGSNNNSLDEALKSTQIIAKVVAKYLK